MRKKKAAPTGRLDGVSCVVTGGAGLVGRRLCEMMLERGAKRVVAFDIAPEPAGWPAGVEYFRGDLTKVEDVEAACRGADSVWHNGALVGPYHPQEMYKKVNYEGTLHVIATCRKLGIGKIVFSSSPGTRFDGNDISGLTEDDLKFPKKYLQAYAETKAMGEMACREANDGKDLLTIAVAPHQVYGPHDQLFLANFIKAAPKLRVFGAGKNKISTCFVDNYCHALILGHEALYPGSPALGKFYIATDGPPVNFWGILDHALTEFGYPSVKAKIHLPYVIEGFRFRG